MCCIFTCCGWMVDLIQRLWVFLMSCCISSAVGCVMVTSSMSGIALGYNYSLAEYIELKETNVSIYLKRGIFDDEVADDMEWRRSGHHSRKGHLSDENLRTGAPADDESTSIRSGRRLDDSVFDADDQNKFEGSLMKLTAKPVHLETTKPQITDDFEMSELATKYPRGSLDHMKAVQGLIESRRRMAASGTTLTPVATYPLDFLPYLPANNNPLDPSNRDAPLRRRMEQGGNDWPPNMNPARLAVPDESIGSRDNWVIPKNPYLFKQQQVPDYFILSPTYPSAITIAPNLVRPSHSTKKEGEGAIIFVTRMIAHTSSTVKTPEVMIEKEPELSETKMPMPLPLPMPMPEVDLPRNNINLNDIKANDVKLPKMEKSSEEEYEDEIKGLPVRKRRNAEVNNESHRGKAENRDGNNNQKAVEDTPNLKSKRKQSLLNHLITTMKSNKVTLEEVTPKESPTPKDTSGSFESKIVSSKYAPNDDVTRFNVKQTTVGKVLLSSTVKLNEDVGLFRKPASRYFLNLFFS
uniref:SFRICE_021269 n=1 Tax=Spodoptera frugiperda TaxID=7108 RepID=A0A2H1V626_SPOFR